MCENGQQHHFRLGWAPQRVFPIEYVSYIRLALRCLAIGLELMPIIVS